MIYFDKTTKTFYLESKNLTYSFCVNRYGFLQHLYFGKRIDREDLTSGVCLADRGHASNIAGAFRYNSLNELQNLLLCDLYLFLTALKLVFTLKG